MSSLNPFSWAINAVTSPDASRSNKKRKLDDVDSAADLTLESVMGEIKKLKESNARIESMLKVLVGQTKCDDGEEEEEVKADEDDNEKEEDAADDQEEEQEEKETPAEEEDENVDEQLSNAWLSKFEELKEFKEKYGHCQVSRTQNPALGRWVVRQRSEKRTGSMRSAAPKIAKLNKIDFSWESQANTPAKKKRK